MENLQRSRNRVSKLLLLNCLSYFVNRKKTNKKFLTWCPFYHIPTVSILRWIMYVILQSFMRIVFILISVGSGNPRLC